MINYQVQSRIQLCRRAAQTDSSQLSGDNSYQPCCGQTPAHRRACLLLDASCFPPGSLPEPGDSATGRSSVSTPSSVVRAEPGRGHRQVRSSMCTVSVRPYRLTWAVLKAWRTSAW
jgi:hypothetical protein